MNDIKEDYEITKQFSVKIQGNDEDHIIEIDMGDKYTYIHSEGSVMMLDNENAIRIAQAILVLDREKGDKQ